MLCFLLKHEIEAFPSQTSPFRLSEIKLVRFSASSRRLLLCASDEQRYQQERATTAFNDNPTSSRQKTIDSNKNILSNSYFALLSATAVILLLLFLPVSVSHAIDHPVDHSTLGIPIPVPDYRYFVSGGICAAASHGISVPLDVVKTRIQAEPLKFQGRNVLAATNLILEQDGAVALLGGLAPTIAGYGLEGAAKFGLYESLKPVFSVLASTQAAGYLGASVTAGAFASLLLVPLEQTRIRLVTDPSFADGLFSALARMAKEEGLETLFFGGFLAMLSKQVPYTFCKQVSFDVIAAMLYTAAYNSLHLAPNNIKVEVSIVAAFLASILACIASHPGDVILTDTYKKDAPGSVAGNGGSSTLPPFMDVISVLYKDEGINGFFTGIGARFLHVGAIITSQLVLYDFIKQLLGLPATGA